MRANELVEGRLYEFEGETWVFAYLGGTGKAILHPPGEPDMQSSIAVDPERIGKPTGRSWAAGDTAWAKLLRDEGLG